MSNVIEWPGFNIRKQAKTVKFVCCAECHQAFFNIILDEEKDDLIFECAMCGTELKDGSEKEV